MADMLVSLRKLPSCEALLQRLEQEEGVEIFRPLAPDKRQVVQWVRDHSTENGAGECEVCFAHTPVSCFVAVRGKEILGYACYDAIAPDFFGPTRVLDKEQGKGIGKALLLRSLWAQREAGYAYAIIGGVGPAEFYEKAVGAVIIQGSAPGIYQDFIGRRP